MRRWVASCSMLLPLLGVALSLGAEPQTKPAPPANPPAADAAPSAKEKAPAPKRLPRDELPADWVESIVQRCQPSVVVITVTGRDGKQDGLGSGFVISPDGLIATNLHVIGEARPIHVRMTDGKRYEVTAVEATDRALDLALIRIGAKDLPALPLGDSDTLRQGQRVVALGNPLGLEHSVVSGVVSGSREIDGRPMIQLAIPIEPGNSGGPLVDDQGRVHGLMTMKSLVTANLGFAVKVNSLKPLIEKPNPVPIERWLTIGTLDPREWRPLLGGTWRQRAGRISVEGKGSGFGGRALCIAQDEPPEMPYELAVEVKLGDEAGAAGLVFAVDTEDRHYGFYPSNGRLRLSRFDGADVLNWNVLFEKGSPHYRPGDWNLFKVRVSADKLQCWVNDQLVLESDDAIYRRGKVGLAKFRDTKAEFRQFRMATEIPSTIPTADQRATIEKNLTGLKSAATVEEPVLDQLAADAAVANRVLRERVEQLRREAKELDLLAEVVHRRAIEQQLAAELARNDDQCDLVRAALLLAKLDNPELDIDAYRDEVDRLARDIQTGLDPKADELARLAALDQHLFREWGFHGSRGDYDNRSNSYLNEVIDDREGLPITLSLLYMELGQRLGLKIVGVGTPAQFMVRFEPREGESIVIDPFDGGERLTREALDAKIRRLTGQPLRDEQLAPVTKRQIVERMLRNLLGNASRSENTPRMLHYLDAIVAIAPTSIQERLMRAVIHYRTGVPRLGLRDTAWLLDNKPEGVDLERVLELHQALERADLKRVEQETE